MALLSDATVVVEAGEYSGTEHQSWEALGLGRELLILESLVSSGTPWIRKLVDHGAQVLADDKFGR